MRLLNDRNILRLSSWQHLAEFSEQVLAVVRTGRCLGMILHAEDRQMFVPHPFQGLVVQVDMSDLDVGGKRRRVDRKPVVLSRDLDLAGLLVADRMIDASVSELELESLGTQGLAEKLMSQADAENRDPSRLCGSADERLEAFRWLRRRPPDRRARSR